MLWFVVPAQDTTKNYSRQQAAEQLQLLLQLPWQSASLQTLTHTTNVQITRKGRVLVHRTPAAGSTAAGSTAAGSRTGLDAHSSSNGGSAQQQGPLQRRGGLAPAAAAGSDGSSSSSGGGLISLQHDRVKALPINGSIADPFLQQIGLQTVDGRIKASMQVGGLAAAGWSVLQGRAHSGDHCVTRLGPLMTLFQTVRCT